MRHDCAKEIAEAVREARKAAFEEAAVACMNRAGELFDGGDAAELRSTGMHMHSQALAFEDAAEMVRALANSQEKAE